MGPAFPPATVGVEEDDGRVVQRCRLVDLLSFRPGDGNRRGGHGLPWTNGAQYIRFGQAADRPAGGMYLAETTGYVDDPHAGDRTAAVIQIADGQVRWIRRSRTGHQPRVHCLVVSTFRISIPAIANRDPNRYDDGAKRARGTDYLAPRREDVGVDLPEEPHLNVRGGKDNHVPNTAGATVSPQSVERPIPTDSRAPRIQLGHPGQRTRPCHTHSSWQAAHNGGLCLRSQSSVLV